MIPVTGGHLRNIVTDNRPVPDNAPLITYPESSILGQMLYRKCQSWRSTQRKLRPICETAFAAGIREMVLRGKGVALSTTCRAVKVSNARMTC